MAMPKNQRGQQPRHIVSREASERNGRLAALKKQLADMDYMTSKHADGEYRRSEWKAIVKKRREIRNEIQALENGGEG